MTRIRPRARRQTGHPAQARRRHRPTMALAMIVRDEAENLPTCLGPITGLFDEIIMVDTGSRDGTPEIARELGAQVYSHPWNDDFSAARNESLRHVTADWVLWLDADDRVAPAEAEKLRRLAAMGDDKAYYCTLVSHAAGSLERSSCLQLRFFPMRPNVAFEGRVHEQVIYSLNRAGVKFANSDVRIVHTGYADAKETRAKFQRNLRILREELAARPDEAILHYHLAHSLNAVGERGPAIEAARHLIEGTDCRTANRDMFLYAHIVLARFYEEDGDLASKSRWLRQALTEDGDYAPAHFFLGEQAFREGRWEEARGELEAVARAGIPLSTMPVPVRPILHLTHYYLGRLAEGTRQDTEALASFQQSAAAMPELPLGWAAAAQTALRLGRYDDALTALRTLVSLGEEKASIHFNIGLALLESGHLAEARESLRRALEMDAGLAPAWVNLGNIDYRLGALEAAGNAYREALRLDPSHSLAHLNYGKSLLRLGRAAEAEGEFTAALAGNDPPVEALAHLGDLCYARQDYLQARDLLEAFLSRHAPRPIPLLKLADCYFALGYPEAALAGYRGVLDLDPRNELARERIDALTHPALVTAH